jgi:hypothetical protein
LKLFFISFLGHSKRSFCWSSARATAQSSATRAGWKSCPRPEKP